MRRIAALVVLLVLGVISLPLVASVLDGEGTENLILPVQLVLMAGFGALAGWLVPTLGGADATRRRGIIVGALARAGRGGVRRWSSSSCCSTASPAPEPARTRHDGRMPGRRRPCGASPRTHPPRTAPGWNTGPMRRIVQSKKLQHVRYDVRGPILVEAQRLEAEGHKILKLNIGNPAPFGFEAPEAIVADMIHNLPDVAGLQPTPAASTRPAPRSRSTTSRAG